MEKKELELDLEANDIGKEIKYLLFSILTVALIMLTCTLIYSLFK